MGPSHRNSICLGHRPSPHKLELTAEKLSVHVATTTQAIEELRPVWRKWTHSLDTDIEYYLHSLSSDSTIVCPYVISVCESGIALAMLVGVLKKRKVSDVVPFVGIPGPTARVLEIMKAGRMGLQGFEIDNLIALQLSVAIKCEKIDFLCFQRVPLHSELLSQVRQVSGLGFNQHTGNILYNSVLSLTSREAKRAPVFSGKIMREVRRKTRILQQAFPGKTRFKCFSELTEMGDAIRDAMTIADSTWQYSLDCGLVNNPQTHESFKFFARQGWLRIYILYVDDLPCAFLIGQLYDRTFYCQYAGYNSRFARFSVGSLLTAWALGNLAETGVEQVDLGDGSQEYNRRQGCEPCEDVRLHVYSRTLRGFGLSVFFSATQIAQAGGRKITSGLGLRRIGKIWRDFLVARSTHGNSLPHSAEVAAAGRRVATFSWSSLQLQLPRRKTR